LLLLTAMNLFEGDFCLPQTHPPLRVAIIASRWNATITDALVNAAYQKLISHGVPDESIDVVRVPGAWEIPLVATRLAAKQHYATLIALGCVIRGDTRHYEHVADRCAEALMQVQLTHAIPVLNGVLAVEQREDAENRAGGSHGNKGEECALAALEMVNLLQRLPA